jgi:O-methyltransferase involved in polyketide biosynthesis
MIVRTDLIEKSEFDFERPTHFIWEGNMMYLTAAAVSHVLGVHGIF